MALNVSLWVVPWPVFFVALILIVAAIIALTVIERVLHRKVVLKKEEADTYFRRRLEEVKSLRGNPLKFVAGMDDVAREFFRQEYQVTNARYSDLVGKFRKEGDGGTVKFCEIMQEALYSGEGISKDMLSFLFNRLSYLIREREKVRIKEFRPMPVATVKSVQEKKVVKEAVMQEVKEKKVEVGPAKPITRAEPVKPTMRTVPAKSIVTRKPGPDVNRNVLKYLNEGLKRGFNIDSLTEKLLMAGFSQNNIEIAIRHVNVPIRREVIAKPKLVAPVEVIDVKSRPKGGRQQDKGELHKTSEGKRILTSFFKPKNKDLDAIKKEVEARDSIGKAEVIEVVPYENENVKIKKKKYPKKEPKSYESIENLDDFERVRSKIKQRRQSVTAEGHRGAGLGKD